MLLFSDGGYAEKSWKEMLVSGIADDRVMQEKSLKWIREESIHPDCVASMANHDPDILPQTIEI